MAQQETLNNNALASLDEVKRFMNITGDTDDGDDELTALINRVSKHMETYCDRKFYIQEFTETYRGDGSETLTLDHYPITSVSGVWQSLDRTWDSTTLIDSSEYFIDRGSRSIVYFNNEFYKYNYETIKVIYSAGLFSSIATVPADLKLACLKEVARKYRFRKDNGLSSRSSDTGGAGGIDTLNFITDEFMPETIELLNRYKRLRFYS